MADALLKDPTTGKVLARFKNVPDGMTDQELLSIYRQQQGEEPELDDPEAYKGSHLDHAVLGANQGMANLLGLPVDAATAAINAAAGASDYLLGTDLPRITNPVGGSESIAGVMRNVGEVELAGRRAIGMGVPVEDIDNAAKQFSKQVGQEIAEGVGFGGGIAAAGKFIRGGGAVKNALRNLSDAITTSPGKALGIEVAIAPFTAAGQNVGGPAGEATGRTLGHVIDTVVDPNEETYADALGRSGEVVGTMAGSMLGGGIGQMTMAAPGAAARGYQTYREGTGSTALQKRAAEVLYKDASPKEMSRLVDNDMDVPPVGRATTGEMMGSPSIIAKERAIATENSSLFSELANMRAANREAYFNEYTQSPGYSPRVARDAQIFDAENFFDRNVKSAVKRLNRVGENALKTLDEKMEGVRPERGINRSSADAFYELEAAKKRARDIEKEMWRNVPGADSLDITKFRESLQEKLRTLPEADLENRKTLVRFLRQGAEKFWSETREMPDGSVERVLKDNVPVDEILAFRTAALDKARELRGKGLIDEARMLNDVSQDTFNALMDMTDGVRAWEEARAVSRHLNDMFSRGPIGDLLGHTQAGDWITDPATFFSKALSNREVSADNLQQIRNTISDPVLNGSPEALADFDDAARDYLRGTFVNDVFRVGEGVDAVRPSAWIAKNKEILSKVYPDMEADLLDLAQNPVRMKELLNKRIPQAVKRLDDISAANRFLLRGKNRYDRTPAQRIDAALGKANQGEEARKLMRDAAKDSTGAATRGVKAAALDWLEKSIFKTDAPGNLAPELKVRDLRSLLNTNRKALNAFFGERFVKGLDDLSRSAEIASRHDTMRGLTNSPTAERTNLLQRTAVSAFTSLGVVVGSKIGTLIGAHPLMAAGTGRRGFAVLAELGLNGFKDAATSELIAGIIEKAALDPDFARLLAKKISEYTPKDIDRLRQYGKALNRALAIQSGIESAMEE